MSHRIEKRARRASRAAMMTAVSLPAMMYGATASAQQAPTASSSAAAQNSATSGTLEEVIVTGFRASLQSALENKRKSTQIIESIAPEDIGKMPDQNVSESLQRLPGVSINRSGGKGTQVLINGLGNNLITLNGEVLLTGREMYSSGEGSGGGGNIQYASLEGIPSEQLGGVDVIKTPRASDREGGLGGQVDLKTRSPLSQNMGLNLAGNARGSKSKDADGGATPVVTLVGGFKFSEDFAVTASVSYDDEKTHTKEFQDQNRSQWLFTNTATDGSYVGSPIASTNTTLTPGATPAAPGQTYIDPQLAYFSDILNETKTKGASLGAEWNWNENVKSSFTWFYSKEEETNISYSNKLWFSGGSGQNNHVGAPASFPGIDPTQPYSIDPNGVLESATMMANGAETNTIWEGNTSQANNYQFKTAFTGGSITGNFAVAYAKATGDQEDAAADVEHGLYSARTLVGGVEAHPFANPTAPGCDNGGANCTNGNHGYSWNWNNGGTSGLPTGTYSDNFGYTNLLTNPDYTVFKSNWAWANKIDEKNLAVKFDLSGKLGELIDWTAGARYSDREVNYVHGRYLINGAGVGTGTAAPGGTLPGAGDPGGNCCLGAASGTWIYYSDPGYADIPYLTPGTNATGASLNLIYNNFANGPIAVKNPVTGGMTNPSTYLNTLWTQAGVANNTEAFFKDALNSYQVKEKTTAVFVMGDSGNDVFHANYGVRILHTSLEVDGGQTNPSGSTYVGTASWNGVNANDVAFSSTRSYTDVLPSFNFTLNVADNQKLRFAAARVQSPQNLNDIGRGLQYGYTRADVSQCPGGGTCFTFDGGNGGNAKLDPFRASQFNINWEYYAGAGGLFSAGYFYKAVDNFVTTSNSQACIADGTIGGCTVGNIASLTNGGTGKIYGVELTAQYAFGNGFGFQANVTKSNSESSQNNAIDKNVAIPGVPKTAFNVIGYFERAGFSGRLAYAWRDKAVNSSSVGSSFSFQDITGSFHTYTVYSAAYGQLDGQLGYDFSPHLGLVLSAVNLSNSKQHTYLQWPNEPFTYDDTGRRLFFGVKAKL